jgi:hypothetical protein
LLPRQVAHGAVAAYDAEAYPGLAQHEGHRTARSSIAQHQCPWLDVRVALRQLFQHGQQGGPEAFHVGVVSGRPTVGMDGDGVHRTHRCGHGIQPAEVRDHRLLVGDGDVEPDKPRGLLQQCRERVDVRQFERVVAVLRAALTLELVREVTLAEGMLQRATDESVTCHGGSNAQAFALLPK